MRSEPKLPGEAASQTPDLAFRIELWDAAKATIEQVLAVASYGSIAFAAYNAAIRDYPDRYVTLRRCGRLLSSCNAPESRPA
jgi:hypothetical protein